MINQNFFHKDWDAKLIYVSNDILIFKIESAKESAICPICGEHSERVHSSYFRTLNDLPVFNYKVILRVRARKFFCNNVRCKQKTFAEKLDGLADKYSRRTYRLNENLIKIAMTLSAEAAYRIMKETVLCISPNTLIRLVRSHGECTEGKTVSNYIGIDDWAIKKRKTYGTLICDLITKKPIDVLPGRDAETISAWLNRHSEILLVSRDRSNVYAGAVTSSLPNAVQVADRWHLLKNVFDAVLQYINTKYPNGYLLKEEENNYINQDKDTILVKDKENEQVFKTKYQAERQANYIKKVQRIQNVKQLFSEGYNISQISEKMDLDRKTVRKYIKMKSMPTTQIRKSINIATPYQETIKRLALEGFKPKYIHEAITKEGYKGSERFVRYIIEKYNYVNKPDIKISKSKKINKSQISSILWKKDDKLTDNQKEISTLILNRDEDLRSIREFAQYFRAAVDNRDPDMLENWISTVTEQKNKCFYNIAVNMKSDLQAIKNALIYPYSNGVLEGNVNRLKVIKRQMYGRANFDLLRKKVLFSII